ncbi:MAG: hypothetical protein N3F04_06165 [Candidatus Nezhaarchaeota archaeon]|nr:hypothetical protein [Candidatus Nezhaarchaeota archaeon]
MSSLLVSTLEAFLAIAITASILSIAYSLSVRATRSVTSRSSEKQKPFACGEALPSSKTGLPDVSMYSIVWKRVFKSLYDTLRDKVHTGILSDWLAWMFAFMVITIIALIVVIL